MRESIDITVPPSQSRPHRPTTSSQLQRLRTADPAVNRRPIDSRASTEEGQRYHEGRPAIGSARLTSLSALYQPAFKPYAFSHMYATKYNDNYQGRYQPPPSPTRPETTNNAPIDYRFGESMYKQQFQTRKPMTLAFVVPYSRHRKNNPQPTMNNTYNYPNTSRWIWSAPTNPESSQGNPAARNPYRYHRWCSR